MYEPLYDQKGQASVELALFIPVVVILASLVINVLVFLGDCGSFDMLARAAIVREASEASFEEATSVCSTIEAQLSISFPKDYQEVMVRANACDARCVRYVATYYYTPSFFFHSIRDSLFGVSFQAFSHSVEIHVKPVVLGGVI